MPHAPLYSVGSVAAYGWLTRMAVSCCRSGGLQRSPTAGSSSALLRTTSHHPSSNNQSSHSLTAAGTGLGALTEHNLSMLCGGPSTTVVKGIKGCR